jgi:hypothetical protein
MAQPALDFFRKRSVLVKAEVTEGTDPIPVGGTDGIRFFDGSSSTEFDTVDRNEDKAHFGNNPFAVANRRATVQGTFELYPPATPGAASTSDADCAKVLLPSGFAVTKNLAAKTTRYNPISAAIPSVTAYWYHTSTLLKILGARGNLSSLGIEIGQRFTGQASLMGEYTEVTSAAMPSVTLPTKVPVVSSKRNSECIISTLGRGATASSVNTPLVDLHTWAKALTVDLGNALAYREYTEKGVAGITDRAPTFTLRLAKTDISADFNPWFVRDNGIIIEAAYRLYEDDTKDALWSELGIRGQIEQVTPTDIDGDYGWELTGRCIPSSAGNDELYIAFGDDTP